MVTLIAVIAVLTAFVLWLAFTPSGKAFASQAQAQQQARQLKDQQDKKKLKQSVDQLFQSPDNQAIAREALQLLKTQFLPGVVLGEQKFRKVIELLLHATPGDTEVQDYAFTKIKAGLFSSQQAYSLALNVLEQHPTESKAKQFALAVGRWHFGKQRGGKVTIYDEQAIQNDISVRSR